MNLKGEKCCKKHNKMGGETGECGMAGRYQSIWDSYCCNNCPSLNEFNVALMESNRIIREKYKGKVFCKTCVVKDGSGIFDSQEKLNKHLKEVHFN